MNLVSFVIPSYNEQENIIRLSNILTDILRKYKNIEVIIVDNGSTDKTSRILKNHKSFTRSSATPALMAWEICFE